MDTTTISGGRPSGQRKQQIVSGIVSLNQPAPELASDPLYVVVNGVPVRFEFWPMQHGSTLPQPGDAVRLGFDERGRPFVDSWDGVNVLVTSGGGSTGVAVYSYAVPAVASYSISHMLGRYPVGPTFYDSSGFQDEVGFQATDVNTLVVTQGAPIPGTVVFA